MTDRREKAMVAACHATAAMMNTLKASPDRATALASLRLAVATLEPQLSADELADCLATLEEHSKRAAEHRKGLAES